MRSIRHDGARQYGFSLKLRRASKTDNSGAGVAGADILGLTTLLDRYPRQLSGASASASAMGRAIVRDPQVFLFDEPLSNLDAKLRVQMPHRDQGTAPAASRRRRSMSPTIRSKP